MRIPSLSGGPIPLDRFRQVLNPDDMVLYDPPTTLAFRVLAVRPVLDRSAPPGTVMVTLTCTVTLPVQGGSPVPVLTRIGYVDHDRPVIGSPVRHPGQPEPVPPVPDVPVPELPAPDQPDPAPGPRLVLP